MLTKGSEMLDFLLLAAGCAVAVLLIFVIIIVGEFAMRVPAETALWRMIRDALRDVLRNWFGPPKPRFRVIGTKGPEDVLMEGEEAGLKSMFSQIPLEQRRGWRIERIDPGR
jgi:hypothetical protein